MESNNSLPKSVPSYMELGVGGVYSSYSHSLPQAINLSTQELEAIHFYSKLQHGYNNLYV